MRLEGLFSCSGFFSQKSQEERSVGWCIFCWFWFGSKIPSNRPLLMLEGKKESEKKSDTNKIYNLLSTPLDSVSAVVDKFACW